MDSAWGHFGQWGAVAIWIVLYGVFIAFLPFYRKSQRRSSGVYLAFVIAYALEMFGVPMSMYILGWAFGLTLADGVLWGHTLINVIGFWGMYIGGALSLTGVLLVVFGWKEIHRHYWGQEQGQGELVTHGIYRYIRHPQYTGFLLITLGMMCEWATPPLILMWPILIAVYYRLARREECEVEAEFGSACREYRNRTGMFLPRLLPAPAPSLVRTLSPAADDRRN
jgi:methanethiol S-methyltransferase